jgi:hypothetical protein
MLEGLGKTMPSIVVLLAIAMLFVVAPAASSEVPPCEDSESDATSHCVQTFSSSEADEVTLLARRSTRTTSRDTLSCIHTQGSTKYRMGCEGGHADTTRCQEFRLPPFTEEFFAKCMLVTMISCEAGQCCPWPSAVCRATSGTSATPGSSTVNYNSIITLEMGDDSSNYAGIGVMAEGCVAQPLEGGGDSVPQMLGMFFMPPETCAAAPGFFLRPPAGQPAGDCVHYGDAVVFAQTGNSDDTDNCGWYGCRVAQMQTIGASMAPGAMSFGHGGDEPETFYLRPIPGSGKTGCVMSGDDVVIAQTADPGNTGNCGWYGCRVAFAGPTPVRVDADGDVLESAPPTMLFDHGGAAPQSFRISNAQS